MPKASLHEVRIAWRGVLANAEVNELHAEAFKTRVFEETEWDWEELPTVTALAGHRSR